MSLESKVKTTNQIWSNQCQVGYALNDKWIPFETAQILEALVLEKAVNKCGQCVWIKDVSKLVDKIVAANKILDNSPRDLSLEAQKMLERLREVLQK